MIGLILRAMLSFAILSAIFVFSFSVFYQISDPPRSSPDATKITEGQAVDIAYRFLKSNPSALNTLEFDNFAECERFFDKHNQYINVSYDDNWIYGRGSRYVVSFSRRIDNMLVGVTYEISLHGKYIISEHADRNVYR